MDVLFPTPGKYVLAVSGGVDSMALLDILQDRPGFELVAAHYDHGIRPDSDEDRRLVAAAASGYGLPFVYEAGQLGPEASEAQAREARYVFLRAALKKYQAEAIITAHHQDDVIETAVINLLRGTGRRGLTSLSSREGVIRPLLNVSKQELIKYARDNDLSWREDSTNEDEKYLRNYVRRQIIPKFNEDERQKFTNLIKNLQITNHEIDSLLVKQLKNQSVNDTISRSWFAGLKHNEAREFLAAWLRLHGINSYESGTLERLVVAAKTAPPGKTFPVVKGYYMLISKTDLALTGPER